MDVWTVLDHTWSEGGSVLGVATSLEGAKGLAARDYPMGQLEWQPCGGDRYEADQGSSPQSYIVQRWAVEPSMEASPEPTPQPSESTP